MSASKLTTDDIARVTLDYFFKDEDRVVDTLWMLNASFDFEVFESFLREAGERGYERERLIALAHRRKWKLEDLLRNRRSVVCGGSAIKSPFSYPSGMPDCSLPPPK